MFPRLPKQLDKVSDEDSDKGGDASENSRLRRRDKAAEGCTHSKYVKRVAKRYGLLESSTAYQDSTQSGIQSPSAPRRGSWNLSNPWAVMGSNGVSPYLLGRSRTW